MEKSGLNGVMLEDLNFATGAKPLLADLAALSAKSPPTGCSAPSVQASGRRRPRPPSLARGTPAPPSALNLTPRPPVPNNVLFGSTPVATPRAPSLRRISASGGSVAEDLDGGIASAERRSLEAENARLQFTVGELQARLERQAKELEELRHQHGNSSSSASSPRCPPRKASSDVPAAEADLREKRGVEQSSQTEERAFTEQLDAVHREAAQKGRELRRVQETVRTLRAELQQEKVISEQYRGEVEDLEAQLSSALQKQHTADRERALAEWRLRNAESAPGCGQFGRLSRSSTPQPGAQRVMKAWAESGSGRNTPRTSAPAMAGNTSLDNGLMVQSSPNAEGPSMSADNAPRSGALSIGVSDSEEEGEDAMEEDLVASDDDEDLNVFHPPPSRAGLPRNDGIAARFGGKPFTNAFS